MSLHGLNALIDFKCRLSTPLPQLMEYLKKYISKEGSIDSIIGYKNEIKLAPELDQIRESPRTAEESKSVSCRGDGQVVLWTQSAAKGLVLRDVYILASFKLPLYLYYYWDEIPSSNHGVFNDYYYTTERANDKLLDKNEYEDFIEMVANVVQNVLVKKKRRSRGSKKRPRPENSKKDEAAPKLHDAEQAIKVAKTSPSSEAVYDLDKPFKSLFERPRPQTVDPQSVAKRLFGSSAKAPSRIVIKDPKEKRPAYEPVQQSESEKNSRALPVSGSAANSMRIMTGQVGIGCSGFPPLDSEEIAEMDKAPHENISSELNRGVEVEKTQRKAAKQRKAPSEEQNKTEAARLPHPNDAFKMYPKGLQETTMKENKGEEVNSFW
eukprot:TRINITY_DN9378_c0_g1_i2.p1 TRINITY_DN9378_c0_g1~~TRINITY_DN9378_c0_g1_i2.p1  ORF type:complete len:379 (-),score=94.73 TRINITY_DN9378_c0_g1_i2:35-1171(-)